MHYHYKCVHFYKSYIADMLQYPILKAFTCKTKISTSLYIHTYQRMDAEKLV